MDAMTKRRIIGFIVAPLLIPVVTVLLVLLVPGLPLTQVGQHSLAFRFREGANLAVFVTLIGYVATATLAVPAHVCFSRRGWKSLPNYLFLGAAIGALSPVVYGAFVYLWQFSTRDYPQWVLLSLALVGVACGVPVAALFWYIAVRR